MWSFRRTASETTGEDAARSGVSAATTAAAAAGTAEEATEAAIRAAAKRAFGAGEYRRARALLELLDARPTEREAKRS